MSRILLVDDHVEFLNIQRLLLERAGHTVVTATDGRKAIAMINEHVIDLIITDIVMPGKEGLETIMELRRNNPRVKIIAMSGGGHVSGRSYLKIAEKFGAMRSLEKPFNEETLLATIDGLMSA